MTNFSQSSVSLERAVEICENSDILFRADDIFTAMECIVNSWIRDSNCRSQRLENFIRKFERRILAANLRFYAHELALIMSFFSTLEIAPNSMVVDELCRQAEFNIHGFQPKDIANFMLAFAKLDVQPRIYLISAICQRVISTANHFKVRDVITVLQALAVLKTKCSARKHINIPVPCSQHLEELRQVMIAQAAAIADMFRPDDTADLAWALGRRTLHFARVSGGRRRDLRDARLDSWPLFRLHGAV